MTLKATLILTAVVWVITFPIAWWSLGRLVADAVGKDRPYTKPLFWIEFIFYRLVIFAPYGILLFSGAPIGPLVEKLIWGWVFLGVFLSLLRFMGSAKLTRLLWWTYGWFYDGLNSFYPYRELLRRVQTRMGASGKVLDLGCGTGNLSVDLLNADPNLELVAVDSSTTMLRRARRKLKKFGESAQVQNRPLLDFIKDQPDAEYDHIAMVNVLYVETDREPLWSNLLRILKPDGKITITNSDRGGSRSIAREHLDHDHWWKLLEPRLLVIGIIDHFISQLEKTQVFDFTSEDDLETEIKRAGGHMGEVERAYGGANLLFTVTKR